MLRSWSGRPSEGDAIYNNTLSENNWQNLQSDICPTDAAIPKWFVVSKFLQRSTATNLGKSGLDTGQVCKWMQLIQMSNKGCMLWSEYGVDEVSCAGGSTVTVLDKSSGRYCVHVEKKAPQSWWFIMLFYFTFVVWVWDGTNGCEGPRCHKVWERGQNSW